MCHLCENNCLVSCWLTAFILISIFPPCVYSMLGLQTVAFSCHSICGFVGTLRIIKNLQVIFKRPQRRLWGIWTYSSVFFPNTSLFLNTLVLNHKAYYIHNILIHTFIRSLLSTWLKLCWNCCTQSIPSVVLLIVNNTYKYTSEFLLWNLDFYKVIG